MCVRSFILVCLVSIASGSRVHITPKRTQARPQENAFIPDVLAESEQLHSDWHSRVAHPLSALLTLLLKFTEPGTKSYMAGFCGSYQSAILPMASLRRPESHLTSATESWLKRQADILQEATRYSHICMRLDDEKESKEQDASGEAIDILKDGANKGVWFATELFGKAAAAVRGAPSISKSDMGAAPASLEESIARLQADYEGTSDDPRPYFLTGRMDELLYDENCEFADPFVAFKGRQRFKDNLENLAGGFIIDSSTRTLETVVERGDTASGAPPSYTTKLMVKLQLGLPWKPVLAWPWGVKHEFDPSSGLIVRHIESWDVSAGEGVRQLLKPGPERGIGKGRS
mmetsp:Transcript_142432/g.262546  ORF Transcript_142432/g.262546 Transcript_142432/m.262546 type:complete len:345 (-) Transcript_142432:92-1126(-)